MRNKKKDMIVVDTSPWIALSTCKSTVLLKSIYTEVYIPEGVKKEIQEGGKRGIGVKELNSSRWIRIEKIKDPAKIELLYELDRGEAEVLVLAKEKGINYVLIDEKVARAAAQTLGLKVIGTLGLLLKAKKMGKIPSIKTFIEKMMNKGIWIEEKIIMEILETSGEK